MVNQKYEAHYCVVCNILFWIAFDCRCDSLLRADLLVSEFRNCISIAYSYSHIPSGYSERLRRYK